MHRERESTVKSTFPWETSTATVTVTIILRRAPSCIVVSCQRVKSKWLWYGVDNGLDDYKDCDDDDDDNGRHYRECRWTSKGEQNATALATYTTLNDMHTETRKRSSPLDSRGQKIDVRYERNRSTMAAAPVAVFGWGYNAKGGVWRVNLHFCRSTPLESLLCASS